MYMKRKNRILSLVLAVALMLTFTAIFGSTTAIAADYDQTIDVSVYDQASPPGLKQALASAAANLEQTYLINAVGSFDVSAAIVTPNVTFVIKNGVTATYVVIENLNFGTIIVESGGEIFRRMGTEHNYNKIVIQRGGNI